MGKKNKKKNREKDEEKKETAYPEARLHPETKKSIWAIALLGLAVILILSGLDKAGPGGEAIYAILGRLFGIGYFIMPLTLLIMSVIFTVGENQRFVGITLLGGCLLILSALGLIEIFSPGRGGWLGLIFGSLAVPFGSVAASVIISVVFVISILVIGNIPIKMKLKKAAEELEEEIEEIVLSPEEKISADESGGAGKGGAEALETTKGPVRIFRKTVAVKKDEDYVYPPLSLLQSSTEKPTTGDLRANANIIKRTLEGFGIAVEMGEINIGPKVTRYTLKPAEGMKLSRITALNQDLALALAAHPIRIEAPIPGKSLIGIEVPNKAAALVRLGSLLGYKEFGEMGALAFVLGRDVTGEPIFADIDKMPHLLIAGATGSGKSVAIHSLIISLLYKNSPNRLRFIMVDPKRVELSAYEGIPHLVGPVITENKKAVGVFRWALSEMERRYDLLLKSGSRDIQSYNQNGAELLPYLLIVVDEVADLMTSYGREVEGLVVRLAQMARATGIHLVLSTQRPSVEVVTGLIKANITSRVALQVASQVDSRTILDTAGAEKLLGGGDLLFVSAELSKPKRIQGAYITEKEISAVSDFIRENNDSFKWAEETSAPEFEPQNGESQPGVFDGFMGGENDELFDEAVRTVSAAKKASASLLQRRLSIGYARAARLLDLMEERGLIGPGEGAKPRDVYIDKINGGA